MKGWVNKRKEGWIKRWINEQMKKCTNEFMHKWIYAQMHKCINERMNKWKKEWKDE